MMITPLRPLSHPLAELIQTLIRAEIKLAEARGMPRDSQDIPRFHARTAEEQLSAALYDQVILP